MPHSHSGAHHSIRAEKRRSLLPSNPRDRSATDKTTVVPTATNPRRLYISFLTCIRGNSPNEKNVPGPAPKIGALGVGDFSPVAELIAEFIGFL
jgi:hypothetical protein